MAKYNYELWLPPLKIIGLTNLLEQVPIMGRTQKAIIVGAGAIGVSSAYTLARDGWQVQIIDCNPKPAMGASFGNGRQLSYSHTNALANPHILGQIPWLLARCDDAFRMSVVGNSSYYRWIAKFLANCTVSAYRNNTLKVLALALESQRAMADLLDRHPIDFGHKTTGKLVILRTEQEVRAARQIVAAKQETGLLQYVLTRDEAARLEPAITGSPENIAGAIYAPNDATGDCRLFSVELLDILQRHYGASFTGGATVKRIGKSCVVLSNEETLTADLVVVAIGHRASQLLEPMGHRIPIQPMKGYSFTAPVGIAAPTVSITDSKRRIVFTNLGDRMLVAGIAEMGNVDASVDTNRLRSMISAARASLPEAAVYDEADSGWAGLRPLTPNSQPITRMLAPGLAVNAGHGMLGWTLAMGSAERLARAVRESADSY